MNVDDVDRPAVWDDLLAFASRSWCALWIARWKLNVSGEVAEAVLEGRSSEEEGREKAGIAHSARRTKDDFRANMMISTKFRGNECKE